MGKDKRDVLKRSILGLAAGAAILSGCTHKGEIDETGGIQQVRSACPTAAVAAGTGDVTLFSPPSSTDSRAIDVVAVISGVKSTCNPAGDQLYTQSTFTVTASRTATAGARQLVLPYFSVVMRGGNAVIAKRIGQVTLNFADGQARASATASASSYVDRSAATLPPEIEKALTKPRKSGQADAATDPMSRQDVRDAINRTSFELLVGFNLTPEQLQYNATR